MLADLTRTFPDVFDPRRLLTEVGQWLLKDVAGRCIWISAMAGAYRPVESYLKPDVTLQDPAIQRVLREHGSFRCGFQDVFVMGGGGCGVWYPWTSPERSVLAGRGFRY